MTANLGFAQPRLSAADQPHFGFGYRPRDPVAFARAKAAADARAASSQARDTEPAVASTQAPIAGPSWEGQFFTQGAPPDPTGAIGPTRYIQLINLRIGIYDRSGALIAAGNLDSLTGHNLFDLTDPQIIWDETTRRFYYVLADRVQNTLAWGFSKTDSPSGIRGEWCRYTADFAYGSLFPDYPKLGDTRDFLLVGVNLFRSPSFKYIRADVDWIRKPPPGPLTSCPSQSSFGLGKLPRLTNPDGTLAFTPVPADETDTLTTGYVVAAPDVTKKSADFLTVYEIDTAAGDPKISAPKRVGVGSFSVPPNAPQPGTNKKLDTLDGRLEHAVAAVDPRLGHVAVWTAHAVFGGAGAEERWYELDPIGSAPSVFQSGVATSSTLYVWNGAVSPDRAVGPAGSAFGSNMVMSFNTSSSQEFSAIQMVSKIGANSQSPFVLVKQSPGKNVDFACHGVGDPTFCRWGDYSGAEPDPAASLTGTTGRVWLSNEWNVASVDDDGVDGRTWNWAAIP